MAKASRLATTIDMDATVALMPASTRPMSVLAPDESERVLKSARRLSAGAATPTVMTGSSTVAWPNPGQLYAMMYR